MQYKTVAISGIKTAGLDDGEFEGWASTFHTVDAHGDRVMPGAFAKSIASGRTVPLLWMHRSEDPRSFVGEVVDAAETPEGLKIRGRFDLDTEQGVAAWRQVKSRRVDSLSIGYRINVATKGSDGVNELRDVDLVEISVVARGANTEALVTAVKSAGAQTTETLRTMVARARVAARGEKTMTDSDKGSGQDRYVKARDDQLRLAQVIVEAAQELQRDLTAEEADAVQKHLDEADRLAKAVEDSARSAKILADLDAMAKSRGDEIRTGEGVVGYTGSGSSGDGQRLAFTKGMAAAAVTKILGEGVIGTKAVAPSGAATVGQEFSPDPVALGQPAASLLSVLPVKQHSTPQFAYLRQSVRTNNAAVVAEGAVKPTSVYSVVKIEDQLDVVAHLSEPLPRYWIADNASLQAWLTNELIYGLAVAVEAKALTDIAGTSGIQTNAYATSQLVTLRKSLTKLEGNGYTPGSFVLHPNDWESVELLVSSTNAIEHMGIPYDPASRRLYGVPVVISNAQTQGVAHTLAKDAVGLDTDTAGVGVQWSETSNSDDWSKNLIRARCEGRFAVSVFRPLGVVQSDLTA